MSITSFPNITLNKMIISSKNLGLVFDDKLVFKINISSITKSLNSHHFGLQNTDILSRNLTKTIINDLVLSRLDYSSS